MSKFIDEELSDQEQIESNFQEYDDYSWANQLKEQLGKAIEVWIASAFVDIRAVDILKDAINSLPSGHN